MLGKIVAFYFFLFMAVTYPCLAAVAQEDVTSPIEQMEPVEKLEKGAPVAPFQQAAPAAPSAAEELLTVRDVTVDRTAANAVLAREEAIKEAQRSAFLALAQRNMSASAFTDFTPPDGKVIAALVQDFEIKGEQLSATRYVANFTVRFFDDVTDYISIDLPRAATADGGGKDAAPTGPILVLPYFEDAGRRTVLWADPNPWRNAWREEASSISAQGRQILVPLGDITDVTAGSDDAVWSGDYSVVDKLRQHYGAQEVVVAVTNAAAARVELYSYYGGHFQRRNALTVEEGGDFRRAMNAVVESFRHEGRKESTNPLEAISRALTGRREAVPRGEASVMPVAPVDAAQTEIEAMTNFRDFAAWMDVQRRISGVEPPVKLNIRSLSKGGARFMLRYDGSVAALQRSLAEKGLMLSRDEGVPVYSLSAIP